MSWTLIWIIAGAFALGLLTLPIFMFGLRGTWSFIALVALATFNKMRGRPWDS